MITIGLSTFASTRSRRSPASAIRAAFGGGGRGAAARGPKYVAMSALTFARSKSPAMIMAELPGP